MTGVDWIIIGFVLLLAVFGWAQGFVSAALSLLGFAAGAWLGTRLAPLVLEDGSRSPYAPVFGLMGAITGGAIMAAGFEGLGSALRSRLRRPGLAAADAGFGALLTGLLALGMAWVIGAIALQTPGAREFRRDIQRSAILSRLNDVLPSRDLLNAVARFDPFPRISGPELNVPPPRAAIARDPEVRAAAASVVKIIGTACGLGVQGSGWVARQGVVVTNAHVVAGQDDTEVLAAGTGPALAARAIHFDSRNDLAILRVDGLGAASLPLAGDPSSGTEGAILGFPENGPYDVQPARLAETSSVVSQDAYGRGPVTRRITSLRGLVRSGNSGGPMVDGDGRVLTTIFAAAVGGGERRGFGVPDTIVAAALRKADERVDTGPCAR